jgi:hypothetical protein
LFCVSECIDNAAKSAFNDYLYALFSPNYGVFEAEIDLFGLICHALVKIGLGSQKPLKLFESFFSKIWVQPGNPWGDLASLQE